MAITDQDRVRIREAFHAYERSGSVRKADSGADKVLTDTRDAADAVREQVAVVLAELADDPPVRAARDRAATELRAACVAALHRFRATVELAATDPNTGAVIDRPALDAAIAVMETYLPDGNVGGLPDKGPALQATAGNVRDALAAQPAGAALAANVGRLVDTHAAAMARVAGEADELSIARDGLESARARADRLRRASWHYLNYVALATDIPVDLRSIFPVLGRARADSSVDAKRALDEAGAPDLAEPPLDPAEAHAAALDDR